MDPPVSDLDNINDQTQKDTPSFPCDLYDTELVHKISQTFLPGLATACVDNTTGDIFRSPGSVAADIRKEMTDYLTQRSEAFVAEHTLGGGADAEASHDPLDIVSDFIDDFATSKRNLFSRVSGWLLSERREDNIDDFAQEMEISGFWLSDHIQGLAQTLLKNVDFKGLSHCEMKFQTERELADHVLACGYRTMDCENEGCNAVFCAKQMLSHDSVCPFKIVKCEQNCAESGIMRREMDRHCITVCPMKIVNCAFRAVGCLADVRQCEAQQHRLESVREHLVCVLKSVYKEASVDDLRPRADEIQQLSTRLSEARNARALTNLVKEIDAKLGPLEIKPKSVSTVLECDKPVDTEKKGLEEAEGKGREEADDAKVEEVVKKVSEAEMAENVNEEGEVKAQKLLEIGEFIKEGDNNNSAGDLSERTETKAPEVVVMDKDREEEESPEKKQSRADETIEEAPSRVVMDKEENEEGAKTINLSSRASDEAEDREEYANAETKQTVTNETRGLETEANEVIDEENRETEKSDETKREAPARIVMDKEENEEGAETINSRPHASVEDRKEDENAETKQSTENETRGVESEVDDVTDEKNIETEKSDETKSEAPTTTVMDKDENVEGAETINSRPHASASSSDEAEALSKSSEAFSKTQAETEPNLS